MAFSDERFRKQLIKLEAEARHHPRRHALRLFALIALGYAYPVGILLACCSLVVLYLYFVPPLLKGNMEFETVAVAIVGALLVIWLAGAVLAKFLKGPEPPTGKAISPRDAPAFWQLLDELKPRFPAVNIERVFIEQDISAGVMTLRRFGFWGKNRSYMFVGLGMLSCTTPAQLRAVLCHEYAHLQQRHTSLAAWMTHMFELLATMAKPFINENQEARPSRGLLVRYFEFFSRQTIPIRRRHEFEADRLAAEVTDADTTASALQAISLHAFRVERVFWSEIWRQVSESALPPGDIAEQMHAFLSSPPAQDVAQNWRRMELDSESPIVDYHPSLRARLKALDRETALTTNASHQVARSESAASLLGEALSDIEEYISASWKASVIANWREQHAYVEFQRKRAAEDAHIEPDEAEWRKIEVEVQYGPHDDSIALLHNFISDHPEHAMAHYTLGAMLMQRHDPRAKPLLDRAVEMDRALSAPALGQQLMVYQAMGRDSDADEIKQRIESMSRDAAKSDKLRAKISDSDELIPHDLTPSHVARLNHALMMSPQIEAVYICRKKMKDEADKPSPVFGVVYRRRTPRRGLLSETSAEELLRSFVNGPCAIVSMKRAGAKTANNIVAACPSPVFMARTRPHAHGR